jgi:hypothetical protein
MKDKKAIKREILHKFRALGAETHDTLPSHWIELVYLKRLNAEEQKLFKKAVQELTTMGIVEDVEGPSLNLRLTRKGENLIYSGEAERAAREAQGSSPFQFTGSELQ